MTLTKTLASLLGFLVCAAFAAAADDSRRELHRAALEFTRATEELTKEASLLVRPENDFRRRILDRLAEFHRRAGRLADATGAERTRGDAFRWLARTNDLAGHIWADLPRSAPFAPVLPRSKRSLDLLAAVNRAAGGYFGAPAQSDPARSTAREVSDRAEELPARARRVMGHSGRRHRMVTAFEEFAAHARKFSQCLDDPLVTQPGRTERMRQLLWHAESIDRLLIEARAGDALRASWTGVHETLRLLPERVADMPLPAVSPAGRP